MNQPLKQTECSIDGGPRRPSSRLRRAIRKCAAVLVVLIVPCLTFFSLLQTGKPLSHFSWGAAFPLTLAFLVMFYNFYLCVLRPGLYKLRHQNYEGYMHASVVPLIGSLFTAVAVVLGWGVPWIAFASLATYALDLGGVVAMLIMVWRDASLWDG